MATKKRVARTATKKRVARVERVGSTDITVCNPTNPSQEFIIASEFADDEAIEAELMGKALEHYVYSFPQDGKQVTGMTVAGVNEMSRQLTRKKDSGIKIRIVPDSIKIERNVEENGQKGVSVILFAENMLSGETAIGAKFEPYQKTGRKGVYDNTFALEKAVSKAERNAKRKLIPEKVAIEMIKKFVKQGAVQPIAQPQQVKQIEQPKAVNYLSQLITYVAKEANVIINDKSNKQDWFAVLDLFNRYTGLNIKSLKVDQATAKDYLYQFINSPMMINK